jgi:sugar lactone lactonase YvrE
MPNGIASSRDGKTLYINNYMENRSVRRDATTGAYLGEVAVEQPDNVTVDDQGRIWIAGHHHFVADTTCAELDGPCPLPFSVVRADAETMEGGVVFSHEGPPMGFATVALPVGDKLYLGTAKGDRMVSIPLASVTGSISTAAASSASREAAD